MFDSGQRFEDELHRLSDRELDVPVLDHRHACLLGPRDDVILNLADVAKRVQVPLERPSAPRGGIAQPEVARVCFHIVDREHELDDERALDLRRDHPGDEVDALEHHRPALLHDSVDRGTDADEHVARLREEAVQDAGLVVLVLRRARLEARVVDRRHEVLREEGAHGLADEVGRGDSRDPEPIGDLGRHGRFAGAGRAADQQDDRQVEVVEAAEEAQPPDHLGALLVPPHPDGKLLQPLERGGVAARGRQVGLRRQCQLVRPLGGDAGGDQRPREQALRERQAVLAAERQGLAVTPLAHVPTGSTAAESARASSAGSGSGWPGQGTTSFAARTISTPRCAPASATTSMPAALISVR